MDRTARNMLGCRYEQGMDIRIGPQPDSSLHRFRTWIAAAFVIAVFIALSVWTWRKWPDLLIDFGRELYVPWQLLSGKVLYRDMAYLNGPLSPYLNALWFRIFGTSFTTLFMVNLVITGVLTAALFFLIRRSSDTLTATLSCLVFLCVSAFAHFTRVGNYNFVSPYSHEMTHGIAFSVLMILFLAASINGRRLVMCLASGFCLGLVFLTKADVFVAALAAAVVGLLIVGSAEKKESAPTAVLISAFWLAALLPAAFFLAYLNLYMPVPQALQAIAGTWPHLAAANPLGNAFYREALGISAPWTSLVSMSRVLLGLMLFIASIVVWSLDINGWLKRLLVMLAGAALLALSLLIRTPTIPWLLVPEPLPLLTCLGGLGLSIYCVANRPASPARARLAPLCLWAIFSFFLLAKIILNPKFHHYGFGLAMPGAVFLVVLLVWSLPSLISMLGGRTRFFRLIVVPILIADIGYYVLLSDIAYHQKTYGVGSGLDRLIAYDPSIDPRGPAVTQVLGRIEQALPPQANLAVLPEGAMINYLSRRPNPTPYINLMPVEVTVFGEATILRTFQAQPPEFIILVDKDTTEYGVGPFGVDPTYGKLITDWVKSRYETVWQTQGRSLAQSAFTINILKLTDEKKARQVPQGTEESLNNNVDAGSTAGSTGIRSER